MCSFQPEGFRACLLNSLHLPEFDWVRHCSQRLAATKAIKSPTLPVFVSYSIHSGKSCGWEHKGIISINISSRSFSPPSLWIKLLISCYDYCRRQQVILTEILLHTGEWSGKYTLSNDWKHQSRNLSIAFISCTVIFPSVGCNGLKSFLERKI